MSRWLRNSALAGALLAATIAWKAAWAASDDSGIVVTALRNPVDKSYRRMVKGMELFEQMHAMAPGASLRYKLLPRTPGTTVDAVAVQIVGDSFEVPVTVQPDRTFTLERDEKALREDASVRSDRRAGSMTWRAEVRTPGLPPNARRLGDLRLECRVGMQAGLVSRYPSFLGRLMEAMLDTPELCNERRAPYLFFAERPLFGVTLRAGARSEALSVRQLYAGITRGETAPEDIPYCDCKALLDRAYFVPLGDRSWPDDTLVELEYMDAAASDPGEAILAGDSKAEVARVLGEASVVRFDSGFEVWAYEYGPADRAFAQTELVVLFDPRGTVSRARLRPAPPT